jgi:hypothetical protein
MCPKGRLQIFYGWKATGIQWATIISGTTGIGPGLPTPELTGWRRIMMVINFLRDIGKVRRDAPIMIIAGIAITNVTSTATITMAITGMATTTMITVTGTATSSEHLPPARLLAA